MKQRKLHFGRLFSFVGSVLFWAVAIWLVILLARGVRNRGASTRVESVNVSVVDSMRTANLITSQMVMDMIDPAKIVGRSMNSVDYTKIEQQIAKNGFVESAKVYCGYRGDMHIEVSQRRALARVMVDGYNCYINREGYIFPAPKSTVIYAQVVTGDYPLLVPRGYVGRVDNYMLERIAQIEAQIEQIEREKYALIMQERENYAERGKLKYTSQRMFESRDDYVKRFTELKRYNQRKRETFAYRQRQVARDFESIARRVEAKRQEQLRVMKRCDDIHNLLTLIEMLESDKFWSGEVVQVIVSEGDRGEMRVAISVRSGTFDVTLGELFAEHGLVARNSTAAVASIGECQQRVIEGATASAKSEQRVIAQYRSTQRRLVKRSIEAKLSRVRYFYAEALERVGWDLYRDVNVEFENQIVCRKR